MTAKEIRRIANDKLKSRMKKAMLITLVFSGLNLLMNYVPFIGGMAMIVIGPVLAFGFYKALVMNIEGKEVGVFDYFKLGFDNFTKVWQLIWEVLKKTWVPLLLMILGFFVIFGGSIATYMWSFVADASSIDSISNVTGVMFLIAIVLGFILIIGGGIWYFIKSLRYTLVNFYLIKNPNLTAKEIMEMNEQHIQNNVGKVASIMFFYIFVTFGITFAVMLLVMALTFAIMFIGSAASMSYSLLELITNLFSNVLSFAVNILLSVLITPRLVASYNELHNYVTSNNNFNNINSNSYGNNVNY